MLLALNKKQILSLVRYKCSISGSEGSFQNKWNIHNFYTALEGVVEQCFQTVPVSKCTFGYILTMHRIFALRCVTGRGRSSGQGFRLSKTGPMRQSKTPGLIHHCREDKWGKAKEDKSRNQV